MSSCLRIVVLLGTLALGTGAVAEDAYYNLPIRGLKLTEGTLPGGPSPTDWRARRRARAMQPRAVLDGPGEVYLSGYQFGLRAPPRRPPAPNTPATPPDWRGSILIRAPEGRDVTGRLFVPNADLSGTVMLKFTVPATQAKDQARRQFHQAKESHYEQLLRRRIPGGAWFPGPLSL